jgi:hypothetical protein
MKVVGTIERIKISEERKIVEIVLQTAEEHPNYYTMSYFLRDGKSALTLKLGDMVVTEASLKGRKWADPDTAEIKYFMSLNISKIAIIDMGGNNE